MDQMIPDAIAREVRWLEQSAAFATAMDLPSSVHLRQTYQTTDINQEAVSTNNSSKMTR